MRAAVFGAIAALLIGACGDGVAERIDSVQRTGRYAHGEGEMPYGDDSSAVRSLAPRLREQPAGREILDRSEALVPSLIRLLDDPERRTLATVFLAEIGGEAAAAELLRRWRSLRGDVKRKSIYRRVGSGCLKLGYRYEGVDDAFYGELLMALGYAGRGVSAEIAKDTALAIDESERMAASGKALLSHEEREEDGRTLELRWWPVPIETARQGLTILALLRAPEAPSLFDKAMRSPVAVLRRTAVDEVLFLRRAADRLLPSLGPLLDDAELSADAAEQVGFLLHDEATVAVAPVHALPDEQQAAVVGRCKERLKQLGHLPK